MFNTMIDSTIKSPYYLLCLTCRQVRQHLRQVRAISVWTLDLPVVTDLQTQITILELEGGGRREGGDLASIRLLSRSQSGYAKC